MIENLERKFGKYAVKNLIYYILGAYAIGYILYLAKPEWYEYIVLYPSLVMKGQVWRLFTWVCSIPQSLSIFTIFMFLFYFFIGKSLEQYLGSFKYNLYIFSGWLFTTAGVMIYYWVSGAINGPGGAVTVFASTNYMNLTSFLAFAVLFPETRVLFFGIIPIKMKVLAWIDGIYLGLQVLSGFVIAVASDEVVYQALQMYYGYPPGDLEMAVMKESAISLVVTILISFINFGIFFFTVAKKQYDSKKRRNAFREKAEQGRQQGFGGAADASAAQEHAGRTEGHAGGFSFAHTKEAATERRYRADHPDSIVHTCSVCGRTNITNPELMFRYCSRCSGNHEYCQDHLFTHEHIR